MPNASDCPAPSRVITVGSPAPNHHYRATTVSMGAAVPAGRNPASHSGPTGHGVADRAPDNVEDFNPPRPGTDTPHQP
jgi:hypothetical protein